MALAAAARARAVVAAAKLQQLQAGPCSSQAVEEATAALARAETVAAIEYRHAVDVPLRDCGVLGQLLLDPRVSRLTGCVSVALVPHPVDISNPAKHFKVRFADVGAWLASLCMWGMMRLGCANPNPSNHLIRL